LPLLLVLILVFAAAYCLLPVPYCLLPAEGPGAPWMA